MFKLDFLVGEAFNKKKKKNISFYIFYLVLHVEQPCAFRHTSLVENLKKEIHK